MEQNRFSDKLYAKKQEQKTLNTKELLEREILKCELIEEMYTKQINNLMKYVIHLETQLAIKNLQPVTPVQAPVPSPAPVQIQASSMQYQPSVQVQTLEQQKSRRSKQVGATQSQPQGPTVTKKSEPERPKINWPNIDDIPEDEQKKQSEIIAPEEDTDHEDMYIK